ncbi:MAG TPA: nucleoside hydrolase [Vicinamibacteria bacterium]|nr:nucleoside hydrolase [Vicinamibacteria bacterium]
MRTFALLFAATLFCGPSSEAARRIILDVDPGIDDALAMFLAMRSDELQIEAITVVSGNVLVDLGAENALKLVELAGREDLLVAKGAKYPLQKKLITAEAVHGEDGLGGKKLPAPTKKLDPRHAVDVILDIVSRNPGEITLVPVGPLTNIALAFLKAPEIRSQIPEIVLMGGSIVGGNASPAAEANIYNDPEAAKVVFESGIPIVMVDLGATAQARLTRKDLPRLRASSSKVARYAAELGDFYIAFSERLGFDEGADLHDPLAVALAIDLSIATDLRPMHIQVETKGSLTYGETVANRHLLLEAVEDAGDHYRITSFPRVTPNARVPVTIDSARFLGLFLDRVTR